MFHRTLITTFAAASLVVALTGCEDPAKGKPKATVGSAEAASSAAPAGSHAAAAAPAGEPVKFDNTNGSIGFVGSKVTGKHEGKFEKFEGTFTLAGGKPEGGKVDVTIDLASAKTDQEGLDKHLKTPDFFDVEKTPKATFTSTEIKAGGAGGTHTVTGTLEIRGQKKGVTFPMTITVGDADITGKAEFSINRKDWGIAIAGKPDDLIRDDVVIKLDLKAPKKK